MPRADVAPEHPGRAGGRRREIQQALDERALARAVRPEQPDGARRHTDIDVYQRLLCPVGFAQTLRLDDEIAVAVPGQDGRQKGGVGRVQGDGRGRA